MCATINQITIGSPIGNINWISPSSEPCVVCSMTSVTLSTKKITPLMYELLRDKSDNYFGTLLSISGFFSSFSFFWPLALFFRVCSLDRSFFSTLNFFLTTLLPTTELFIEGGNLVVFLKHIKLWRWHFLVFFLHTHLRFRSTLKRKGTFSYLLDPIFMSPTTLALS